MVRPFLRARATIVTALFGAFLAPATQAADFPAIEAPLIEEGPVEWGSNWYLRGDFAVTRNSPTYITGVALSESMPNNWAIGLGGGYKFNNWFRADATIDYMPLYNKNSIDANAARLCRTGLYADPAEPDGVGQTFAACFPRARNRTESMLVLGNVYLDLGTWYGFTPYIGAGVGVNVLYQRSQINWFMNNGVPYAGITYTDPRNGATYMENWDSKHEGTFLRLAYAFMGGVSYDIDDHWKIDVGYRYANLGKITGVDRFNLPLSRDIISQQVRMGVRYVID